MLDAYNYMYFCIWKFVADNLSGLLFLISWIPGMENQDTQRKCLPTWVSLTFVFRKSHGGDKAKYRSTLK